MHDAGYKNYLLTMLLVMLAANFVDRLALSMVLQDIQADFQLSDTQLGLLTGFGFALLYSIMGVPIARWADRGDRVKIISLTTAVWGVAVVACGFVSSFLELLLIRLGVALGASGCTPVSHSLVGDHFSRAERPRAVAIFMLGAPLSAILGYALAGALNEMWGWRMTFILLGLPGLVISVLAWLTLREPRRGNHAIGLVASFRSSVNSADGDRSHASVSHPRMFEVCGLMWSNRTFRHLLLCYAVLLFISYGSLQWQPTFFYRSYGLSATELGTWMALVYGVGGFVGTYMGGAWASRYAARDERLQLRAIAVAYASYGILSACVFLARNHYAAFGLLALAFIALSMASAPLFATIQTLVPPRMRALSVALIHLVASLVGMGFGPLLTGALSDVLRSSFGDESLRIALLALCPGYLWAVLHAWHASHSVARDVQVTLDATQCGARVVAD